MCLKCIKFTEKLLLQLMHYDSRSNRIFEMMRITEGYTKHVLQCFSHAFFFY